MSQNAFDEIWVCKIWIWYVTIIVVATTATTATKLAWIDATFLPRYTASCCFSISLTLVKKSLSSMLLNDKLQKQLDCL